MSRTQLRTPLLCQALLAFTLCISTPLGAQDRLGGGAPGPKPTPVKVLRPFELGTELEQFAALPGRLLEWREHDLAEAMWKVDERTTMSAVAIIARDAHQTDDRRLGARISYNGGAAPNARAANLLDFDELKELDADFDLLLRALEQAPVRGETISLEFRSRSGLLVALTAVGQEDGATLTAVVGRVSVNGKDEARRIFTETQGMVRRLVNHLASF
jgi:hypothetical protein